MLDVHRLRVFRSVVASGSIQAAAVNLGYTASAVSQHVSALQRETGVRLDPDTLARLSGLHADAYLRRAASVVPLPGARELVGHLYQRGVPFAIATSGARIAHCPTSNLFIAAGVMPLSSRLAAGIPVGLGSDVSGGAELPLFGVMRAGAYAQQARRTLGPDHPETLSLLHELAGSIDRAGDPLAAQRMFAEVHRARVRVHGGLHEATRQSWNALTHPDLARRADEARARR